MTTAPTITAAIEVVLDKIRGALGTTEEPDGSNNNFIVQWYNANVDKIGLGPWCQMTVCWSVWSSGFKPLLAATAWTVQGARNGQANVNGSHWFNGTSGIRAGDEVYFDWTGAKSFAKIDHVGTVEKVNADGTIYTLEGNASNAVRRMHRDAKYIVGYVRLDWARVVKAAPKPPPAPPQPASQSDADKVKIIQGLINVDRDGVWGAKTDAAFLAWRAAKNYTTGQVQLLQKTVDTGNPHLNQDGVWGTLTDTAALTFRKNNLVK